jgi:hypothetical protein
MNSVNQYFRVRQDVYNKMAVLTTAFLWAFESNAYDFAGTSIGPERR